MRRPLFNAASKYMVEVCRDRNLDALVDYFDCLSNSYGRDLSLEIIEECTQVLYNKYPDTYEWMVEHAQIVLSGEEPPNEFFVTVEDLIYLLKAECLLTEDKDFKRHPDNADKVVVTPTAYTALQEAIIGSYDIEDADTVINLDEILEVAEIV